jgi:Phage terminase large subunit (GpA)
VLRHPRDGYFTVGIDSIKSGLFTDLAKDDPAAAGYIAFPSGCEDRLFQELVSEHRVALKRMGLLIFRWEKVSDRQSNEMLDAYVYSQAAMARRSCSWISAERWAELEAQCEGVAPPPRKTSPNCQHADIWVAPMGTISIFALEFSGMKFSCARNFTGGYTLQAGDFVVSMTPTSAGTLAGGGARIRALAETASFFNRGLRPGATYRGDLRAVDGRVAHVEFGVTDGGDIYIELGAGRMALTDQQASLLLAVLDQLAADVTTLYRASAGPPDLTVAQGLRGFPIYIPGGDNEWV